MQHTTTEQGWPICQNPNPRPCAPAASPPTQEERAAVCKGRAGPRKKQVAHRPSGTVQVMCVGCAKRVHAGSFWEENSSGHHKTSARGAWAFESHGICLFVPWSQQPRAGVQLVHICSKKTAAAPRGSNSGRESPVLLPLGCCEKGTTDPAD